MDKIGTIKGVGKRSESIRMSSHSKTLLLQILKTFNQSHTRAQALQAQGVMFIKESPGGDTLAPFIVCS